MSTGTGNGVGAVVVTYRPSKRYVQNLAKTRQQVQWLVVVDNGSTEDELRLLRESSDTNGFNLIENHTNLGIAAALNTGVKWCGAQGSQWVALFDQDSVLTENYIEQMVEDYRIIAEERRIMQIIPRYIDPQTGIEAWGKKEKDGGSFLTVTSGSVFPMEVFDTCGMFNEDLFIYSVDDDYSLRIHSHGFFIGISHRAVLLHNSGTNTYKKILGRVVAAKNYRPEVRYYYGRNKVWILRTWGLRFPRLIVPTLREFITNPLKIILCEPNPWPKIKMFVIGIIHGIIGKMGKLS